jgi:hypothetical protein
MPGERAGAGWYIAALDELSPDGGRMRRIPCSGRATAARRLPALTLLLASMAAGAGDPGRLEEDAEFLLGSWSSDCAVPGARIFLSDGALRQQGLLLIGSQAATATSSGAQRSATPVTLLAATRDGVGLALEARSRVNGVLASARYLARVIAEDELAVKSVTLCRGRRCQTNQLDVPWRRCDAPQ